MALSQKFIIFFNFPARAQELANLIGGPALTLADLENYHPEEGMILANTTAIGMHPNVNETPLSKVFNPPSLIYCQL